MGREIDLSATHISISRYYIKGMTTHTQYGDTKTKLPSSSKPEKQNLKKNKNPAAGGSRESGKVERESTRVKRQANKCASIVVIAEADSKLDEAGVLRRSESVGTTAGRLMQPKPQHEFLSQNLHYTAGTGEREEQFEQLERWVSRSV